MHEAVAEQESSFNDRLLHPRSTKEHYNITFFPAAVMISIPPPKKLNNCYIPAIICIVFFTFLLLIVYILPLCESTCFYFAHTFAAGTSTFPNCGTIIIFLFNFILVYLLSEEKKLSVDKLMQSDAHSILRPFDHLCETKLWMAANFSMTVKTKCPYFVPFVSTELLLSVLTLLSIT